MTTQRHDNSGLRLGAGAGAGHGARGLRQRPAAARLAGERQGRDSTAPSLAYLSGDDAASKPRRSNARAADRAHRPART